MDDESFRELAEADDVLPDEFTDRTPLRAERVGTWKDGHSYRVVLDVEPRPEDESTFDPGDDAETWAVVLHRTGEFADQSVDIVRFDTRHGDRTEPHADKLWLEPLGHAEMKEWESGRNWSPTGRYEHVRRHWKEYVRRYVLYREADEPVSAAPRTLPGDDANG